MNYVGFTLAIFPFFFLLIFQLFLLLFLLLYIILFIIALLLVTSFHLPSHIAHVIFVSTMIVSLFTITGHQLIKEKNDVIESIYECVSRTKKYTSQDISNEKQWN